MAEQDRALLDEVVAGADAMAALARDEEVFRAAVDAFRAYDGESMAKLLERHQLAERCEVVCHWLRSKEAVILCLELAGPPLPDLEPPDPREFAELVAKLTADEAMVRLMVDAVEDRDISSWRALIDKNGIERFSHLLCHWVCTVHYRLVCEVVCSPILVQRPHLGPELVAAGAALSELARDEKTFTEATKAVLAGSCEQLGSVLEGGGFGRFCFFLCEWFCSWRCMLVCLRLCRIYPLEKLASPLDEMREFALAGGALEKPSLERLTAAFLREDTELVQSLAKELQFERFCVQFCHWVCFLRCQLFCVCVCPPRTIGVFTKIGGLFYATDVDSGVGGSGLTVADSRAFFSTLRLNGGLSVVDGAPLIEYRFETIATDAAGNPMGSWTKVDGGKIVATNIGAFIRPIVGPPFIEVIPVWVNNPASGVFNITPDPDGWIQVPPLFPVPPMVPGSGWRFVPGSDLINLNTRALLPFTASVDETGVDAGDAANVPASDVNYGVRMRIRDQGTSGSGTDAGTCSHIAINNTHYDHISHHPYWPGGLFGASDELAVDSIGIAELESTPCSTLANSLTVKYTAAHPHLGAVSVWLEGPGGPYAFTLVPDGAATPDNQFGTANPNGWTFTSLPPCAYLLKCSVGVLLTTGDSVPDALVDYIAFCKGKARIG
ncbi:hypothetical protein [Solirubrobacter soli]|uniref:hypothetical protein n=1 Tax=Solirubrobacter soli TaxID=363832 RepID=UPI0003F96636|nr:hypothetical protein [Solirubrobacter soli]